MNQNWALNLSFRPWPEKNDIFELQIYNLMDSSISFSLFTELILILRKYLFMLFEPANLP